MYTKAIEIAGRLGVTLYANSVNEVNGGLIFMVKNFLF